MTWNCVRKMRDSDIDSSLFVNCTSVSVMWSNTLADCSLVESRTQNDEAARAASHLLLLGAWAVAKRFRMSCTCAKKPDVSGRR